MSHPGSETHSKSQNLSVIFINPLPRIGIEPAVIPTPLLTTAMTYRWSRPVSEARTSKELDEHYKKGDSSAASKSRNLGPKRSPTLREVSTSAYNNICVTILTPRQPSDAVVLVPPRAQRERSTALGRYMIRARNILLIS